MSSFLVTGGDASTARPALTVKNADWWPDISADDLRDTHRITDTVTDARLKTAITTAIAAVNRLLRDWQRQQRSAGHTSLAVVPVPDYLPPDGLNALYLRAVYCHAHALLIERYRDYDASGSGTRDSETKGDIAGDYRREAMFAISDICDRPHNIVELI